MFVIISNQSGNNEIYCRTEDCVREALGKVKINQDHCQDLNTNRPYSNKDGLINTPHGYMTKDAWVKYKKDLTLQPVYVLEFPEEVLFEQYAVGTVGFLREFIEFRQCKGEARIRSGRFIEVVNGEVVIRKDSWLQQQFGAEGLKSTRDLITKYKDDIQDVTDSFIEEATTKILKEDKLTATVTKKGLKSTGKTVTVTDSRFKDVIDMKRVRDQMERVKVSLNGWGDINMSPDSLSEFEITPIYSEILTYSLIK